MSDYRTPFSPVTPPPTNGALAPVQLAEARERAIRLLTDGYAYDVITVEEFEWRLGQLSHADSPAAMDALVADLAAPAPGPIDAGRGTTAPPPTEAASSAS